ncbi:MAG: ATPase [Betaproteobacteria bacterium]|nr:ATPase [Betaproteobacteria bacterium]
MADKRDNPGGKAAGSPTPPLRIVRDFAVAREQVWRAWTEPDAIIRWLGPVDWPAIEVQADVRVGGAWRACLREKQGSDCLWQSGHYLAIVPPERLEFTFAWEGTNHEDGPGVQTHVTVLLQETASGGTRMHFEQAGLASTQSATGHAEGWNSTFGRLDRYLAAH